MSSQMHPKGEVVRLMSGGPVLTSDSGDADIVRCVWLDAKGTPGTADFEVELLRPATEDTDAPKRLGTEIPAETAVTMRPPQVGSVVRLRSTERQMTLRSVTPSAERRRPPEVECIWIDDEGNVQKLKVFASSLAVIRPARD